MSTTMPMSDSPTGRATRPDRRGNDGKAVAPVSAVIATIDRPEALARCLDAVLVGDVLPAEIVVVDQSAGDASERAVARRVAAAPIAYLRSRPKGASAARNAGIAHSNSPIVAMTDDDCTPGPRWIALINQHLVQMRSADALSGRVLPLGPESPGLYSISSRTSTDAALFRGRVLPWLAGTGGNFAAWRSLLIRAGGYDERLGPGTGGRAAEDIDLVYRLLRLGASIRYEPEALVYHERQDRERRLASRANYGFGMGVLCGLWLRRGDRFAVHLLAKSLFDNSRRLAGSLRRGRWLDAYSRGLYLRGLMAGLSYGARLEPTMTLTTGAG